MLLKVKKIFKPLLNIKIINKYLNHCLTKLDLLRDFLIVSPLLVIWLQRMWFSSIRFFSLCFKFSTLSSFWMTVSTTLVLFILFLTNLDFLSLAFRNLEEISSYLAWSLMFSCSSAEVKLVLTWMNCFYNISN